MKFRSFGRDQIVVSEVGLGCWQIGSDAWGPVSDEAATGILEKALEQGISFYDTADVYGAGRSESFVGEFLKKHQSARDSLFIASKVGRSAKIYPDGYTRTNITESIEGSLQRLGIEALDLVQTHCAPPEILQDGEIFEWLQDLVKAGKIKRFGASVESDAEALLCMQHPDIYSIQIIFNVLRQKSLSEVFPLAQEKNVAIIVRLPLNSGLLSGKFSKDTQFDKQDHRNFNRDGQHFNVGETFGGLPYEKGLELVEDLRGLFPTDVPMAQSSLRWCLDQSAVSVIIPGASSEEQVVANVVASEMDSFSEQKLKELADFYHGEVHSHIRGVY
ncbi:MAG: aldo/keto reductase [Candidatus Portiera sp.]|nr:aldo/keto reductase [Portiera sp.]